MFMMVRFEYIPAGAGYGLQKCVPEADALQALEDLRRADAWITSATCFDFDSGYSAPWTVRGLSIRQPHAALIAAGRKRIETRPRRTSYRGPVLIHASRGDVPPEALNRPGLLELSADLPDVRGAFIASAVLTDCVPITAEYADALRASNPAEYALMTRGR